MAGIEDTLRALIVEIGELDDPTSVTPDADLFRDLGLDSMQAMEIVLEIERKLDVSISEQDLRSIRSLGDALKLVERLGVK
jgi:acyl carrier protein